MSNPLLLNAAQESQLFTTSLASDVQTRRGVLKIGNMTSIRRSLIADLIQVKYRAEVVQVVTITTTSITPAGNTYYTIEFGDTTRTRGGIQETLKRVSFQTVADVTTYGNAAAQREAINAGLVSAINQWTSSYYVTAVSLGGGTGITITDSAGYYPVNAQGMTNRLGATYVKTCRNSDGSGFVGTEASITTPAVYSFGVGADLSAWKPVLDQMWGNLISGYLGGTAPKTTSGTYAVSGQKYDGYAVVGLTESPVSTSIRTQTAFMTKIQIAYVDNGTGSDTTNATGSLAFEREFQRMVAAQCLIDPAAQFDFFDNGLIASATYPTDGTAISTTDNKVMSAKSSGQQFDWYINPIGAHTILTPVVGTGGLQPYLDVTTQEGLELSPPNLTQCPKQFVVGKTEYSFFVRVDTGAGVGTTDWKSFSVGFRKKAAYAVDQTAYEAASVATACLGVPLDTGAAPVYNIITGPGTAGALTNTSTGVTPAANSIHDFYITCDINGLVKFYVDGIDKTPLLAANYSFTAGLNIMPFISFRHGAGVSATPKIIQALAIPSITWRQ